MTELGIKMSQVLDIIHLIPIFISYIYFPLFPLSIFLFYFLDSYNGNLDYCYEDFLFFPNINI